MSEFSEQVRKEIDNAYHEETKEVIARLAASHIDHLHAYIDTLKEDIEKLKKEVR